MNEPSKLINKILSEAQEIADAEKQSGKDKVQDILSKAEQKMRATSVKAGKNALTEGEERKRRIKSVYDLEHKKDVLAMKRGVLDASFAKAIDDMLTLPDEKYLGLMTGLLLDCAEDGTGEISVAKLDDKRLNDAFITKANAALKAKFGKGEVTISNESCDKKGGFVYKKGGMEIDCSVEAVVTLAREKMETDVAAILFGSEGEKE